MLRPSKLAKQSKASSVVASTVSSTLPSRAPSPSPGRTFRFFDLAAELRVRIYEEVLHTGILDLDMMNYKHVHPRLALFLVDHRMHEEAYRVFYSQTIRLFPHFSHGRFFKTKKPLLARLPPHYRAVITRLELRLGSGWSGPPPGQNTNPSLGLSDCINLRTIKIYVEIDPSESFFDGHRGPYATRETYQWFCMDLLQGIFDQVPNLETIELDAAPGLKKSSALIMALNQKVDDAGLRLLWASSREWDVDDNDNVRRELLSLEKAISTLRLQDSSRLVEVQA